MEVTTENRDGFTIVKINGKLDTTTYGELDNVLGNLGSDQLNVIVDCQDMSYISSSGLRVFLVHLKKLKVAGGKLILSNIQESIKEIFVVSGFTNIFSIYNSIEEAISA